VGLRTAHKAIAVSENLRAYIKAAHGKNATLIPNGVELPRSVPPALIKDKYDLNGQDYVLFMGRLTPEKRVDWLIRSFQEAKIASASARKLKLVVAGGTSATKAYVEKLHRLSAGDRDIVFPGYVTGQEKDELLTNALFFVLPSSLEGHPIALLEAKSFGCCTIASDIPPHREVIKDGVDGFLFRASDREDLTRILIRLIGNPGIVGQVGKASREVMKKRPTWTEVEGLTDRVYRAALGRPEG
jgi:glycosyltransferase involved in cell wall biosynthesis